MTRKGKPFIWLIPKFTNSKFGIYTNNHQKNPEYITLVLGKNHPDNTSGTLQSRMPWINITILGKIWFLALGRIKTSHSHWQVPHELEWNSWLN